jgi:hypothetical protein
MSGPGPLTGNCSKTGPNKLLLAIGTNQMSTVKQRTRTTSAYVDQGVLPVK